MQVPVECRQGFSTQIQIISGLCRPNRVSAIFTPVPRAAWTGQWCALTSGLVLDFCIELRAYQNDDIESQIQVMKPTIAPSEPYVLL
jgi:hypothetical protein